MKGGGGVGEDAAEDPIMQQHSLCAGCEHGLKYLRFLNRAAPELECVTGIRPFVSLRVLTAEQFLRGLMKA